MKNLSIAFVSVVSFAFFVQGCSSSDPASVQNLSDASTSDASTKTDASTEGDASTGGDASTNTDASSDAGGD